MKTQSPAALGIGASVRIALPHNALSVRLQSEREERTGAQPGKEKIDEEE